MCRPAQGYVLFGEIPRIKPDNAFLDAGQVQYRREESYRMIGSEKVAVGSGRLCVIMEVHETNGHGLCVFVHGGERAHVGGVALAVPRMRLVDDGTETITCDVSTLCAPGHKDVEVAAEIAAYLCRDINQTVSVTVGIHVDDASSEDVRTLRSNALAAAQAWLAEQ